jgi:hypothetical protein
MGASTVGLVLIPCSRDQEIILSNRGDGDWLLSIHCDSSIRFRIVSILRLWCGVMRVHFVTEKR